MSKEHTTTTSTISTTKEKYYDLYNLYDYCDINCNELISEYKFLEVVLYTDASDY